MQPDNYIKIINKLKNINMDISERPISFESGSATILYIKQLTDRTALAQLIVKPMVEHSARKNLTAIYAANNIIFADDCKLDTDETKVEKYLLDGMTVILFTNDAEYIVANLKKVEKRNIPTPEMTYTIRGPRDSFIENLDTNLSLIRYRIKDENLRIDMLEVGERTKTSISVIYIDDIANEKCIDEVKKRIGDIKVDGLCSSGELQDLMLNNKLSIFPQMGIIERSDMACGALLEGKVIILMDGSPWALVAPKVFSEFLWACDDFYTEKFYGTFLRFLRVLALNLSFVVSSLYVGIVAFHNDTLPSSYMIAIAQARAKVPFNALLEVLLIEIIAELIRESLIRVPSKIGTAIGIVGAIIIGQAAVAAGVFSPLLLIVVSLSLMASFVPADYSIGNPFRVLKFILIIATGTLGFYGFTLVIILIVAQLVSINTFGAPYMAPLAPFIFRDLMKSILYSKSIAPRRPVFLKTKDAIRINTRKNK